MDGYTLKALLMITLFGLLEIMLNFPNTRRLRQSLHGAVSEFWHSVAAPPRVLQAVKVKARRRRI